MSESSSKSKKREELLNPSNKGQDKKKVKIGSGYKITVKSEIKTVTGNSISTNFGMTNSFRFGMTSSLSMAVGLSFKFSAYDYAFKRMYYEQSNSRVAHSKKAVFGDEVSVKGEESTVKNAENSLISESLSVYNLRIEEIKQKISSADQVIKNRKRAFTFDDLVSINEKVRVEETANKMSRIETSYDDFDLAVKKTGTSLEESELTILDTDIMMIG